MKDAVVDTSRWTKRNVWRSPSGQLIARPGLRNVYAPDSGRAVVGGFSVGNYAAGEIWHYVLDVATTTTGVVDGAPSGLRLSILDENFEVFWRMAVQAAGVPRAVSPVVVEGQMLVCSPDFPTLWGMVGSTLKIAESQPSVSNLSVIAVPRGLACRWNNRPVVARGPALFVGDPVAATGGDLRSFVALNQNNRPSTVYGLHEAAGGMLVALTADGVWGLDGSAAAVGVVDGNSGDWRLINHHRATSYDSSCVVRGRVYALTRRGWTLVDVEDGDEREIDDPEQSHVLMPRVAAADYRPARMYGGEDGPIVALDAEDALHVTDVSRNLASWWKSDICGMRMRGVLRRNDGGEFLLCEDGVWHLSGNVDSDLLEGDSSDLPFAVLSGSVDPTPDVVRNLRQVHFAAAVGGADETPMRCSVRGQASRTVVPDADSAGLTVGESTWGQAGRRYTVTPYASVRFGWDEDTEASVEVGVVGGGVRIDPQVVVDVVDKRRPDAEG